MYIELGGMKNSEELKAVLPSILLISECIIQSDDGYTSTTKRFCPQNMCC